MPGKSVVDRDAITVCQEAFDVGDIVICAMAETDNRRQRHEVRRVSAIRTEPSVPNKVFGNKKGERELCLYYRPPHRSVGFRATLVRKCRGSLGGFHHCTMDNLSAGTWNRSDLMQ